MLATNVPWPRPSPGELFGSELRFTEASRRPSKSGRFSTPESTIAIVGIRPAMAGSRPLAQLASTPEALTQLWPFDHFGAAVGTTGESGTIALTSMLLASEVICAPVRP